MFTRAIATVALVSAVLLACSRQPPREFTYVAPEGLLEERGCSATRDPVCLEQLPSLERRWFVGQYLRGWQTVTIRRADETTCPKYMVQFVPLSGSRTSERDGVAQTVRARWVGRKSSSSDTTYECRAAYKWRLFDTPGEQILEAQLFELGATPAANKFIASTYFRATAHLPASLVVGLAYMPRSVRGVEAIDANQLDKRTRGLQPIVGADLPIVLPFFPESWDPVTDRLRLLVATTFNDVGYGLYTGLLIVPLIEGPRSVAFPIQLSVGARIGLESHGSYFIAGTYNASGLIRDALGAFGVK